MDQSAQQRASRSSANNRAPARASTRTTSNDPSIRPSISVSIPDQPPSSTYGPTRETLSTAAGKSRREIVDRTKLPPSNPWSLATTVHKTDDSDTNSSLYSSRPSLNPRSSNTSVGGDSENDKSDDESWQSLADEVTAGDSPKALSELNPALRSVLSEAAQPYRTKPQQPVKKDQPILSAQVSKTAATPKSQTILEDVVEDSQDESDLYCCNVSREKHKNKLPGVSFCHGCHTIFCDPCWDIQRAHKKGRVARGHEKIDIAVSNWIRDALEVDANDEEQAYQHLLDNSTLWFGAGLDSEGTPVFRDFGRFASIMAARADPRRGKCSPALISFVGETGAGKSSLIKLLVSMFTRSQHHQTPIVGSSANEDIPTSGDVHLYSDPKTSDTLDPLLYADCEGLHGGTRDPIGAKYRKRRSSTYGPRQQQTPSLRRFLKRRHETSEREIVWADTPQKQSRKYFVQEMYPRLLYTFSDVIVFVMKNPRVVEDVIEQLITWADAVREASSNQPILPHAIIVLNASENRDAQLWNVDKSTQTLIGSVQEALKTNARLKGYADFWRDKGLPLDTVESLLLSYYSSVRVVRIPEKSQQGLVHQQVRQLYTEIADASRQSLDYKTGLRMRMTSEDLQPYLQKAFDHFCTTLQEPFDFVKASYANCNIPSDFSGNILKLAINFMEYWHNRLDGPLVFKEMSFMLASCAMVDAVRRGTPGLADAILPTYEEHFSEALEDFCDRHWPCEYVCDKGRCVNVRIGHSKGHQLQNAQVVDPSGLYLSSFSANQYRPQFLTDIYHSLEELLDKLRVMRREKMMSEVEAAVELHRESVLKHFYRHLGGAKKFISHSACLTCLVFPPEHCLPCGHILCTRCVESFGHRLGPLTIELSCCPMHDDSAFSPRWSVTLHPRNAGVRVLSLDGGGIRGVVELMSLRHIEKELGWSIPLQSFFDLIVGTSTGGIIALGLGEKGWNVEECLFKFESLADTVFGKRKKSRIGFIDRILVAANHGRYKTEPLEAVLAEQFGHHDRLFGGNREQNSRSQAYRPKVAVTATSTNGMPYVFANYNRPDTGENMAYQFLRAENPRSEIKTWEAARATSAAPKIFKAFDHITTGNSFQDGGIYYNNPIEVALSELNLAFPDSCDSPLDLVVSLGTAFEPSKFQRSIATPIIQQRGVISYYKQLIKLANDHVQHSLNSEETWRDVQNRQSAHSKSRFKRLNFELPNHCPKLDDVSKMPELKSAVDAILHQRHEEVRSIADRLLATTFYFRQTHRSQANEDGSFRVQGYIECRFAPGSQEIGGLGNLFYKRNVDQYNLQGRHGHSPSFLIEEKWREADALQIVLTDGVISNMRSKRQFMMDPVTFVISNQAAQIDIHLRLATDPVREYNNSISGFPRHWDTEGRTQRPVQPSLSFSKKRATYQKGPRTGWTLPATSARSGVLDSYAKHAYPGLASESEIQKVSQRLTEPEIGLESISTLTNQDYLNAPLSSKLDSYRSKLTGQSRASGQPSPVHTEEQLGPFYQRNSTPVELDSTPQAGTQYRRPSPLREAVELPDTSMAPEEYMRSIVNAYQNENRSYNLHDNGHESDDMYGS